MKPEELEQLVEALKEGAGEATSPLYILVSIMIVFIPMAARYVKKSFREEVSTIVGKQLETINNLIEENSKKHSDQMDNNAEMMRIMELHISELSHVKDTQEKHGKRIKTLEKEK